MGWRQLFGRCLDNRVGEHDGLAAGHGVRGPTYLSRVRSSAAGADDLVACSDQVLERERRVLIERVEGLKQRVSTHRSVLEQLEVQLAVDERLLREIEELTDRRPQLRLERLDRELSGQRLREVAVEVLRRRRGRDAVHYREWFSLVRAEGWEVRGRDPLNSFLTEVGRAGGVERVGRRTGMYRLAAA